MRSVRRLVGVLVIAILVVLLGVGPSVASKPNELVIYHWWTAGGEKEAIHALFKVFLKHYPNVKIVENPVAGGGGGIMRSQIKAMIMAGNPPDTFQITYGRGMIRSFASVLQPIDSLLVNFDVSKEVIDWGTVNGHMYGVPINIMQNNCLWYNKKLVDKLGIHMPIKSIDDFLKVCEEIKKKGYVPLAVGAGMGQKFWLGTLFETIMLAVPDGGAKVVKNYYAGKLDVAKSPAFKESLGVLRELVVRKLINADFSALTWDQAADLMASGKAVFYVMGDWAKGHFTSMKLKPNVDFGYQSFPGTDKVFLGHSDCFVLPRGVKKKVAKDWLKFLTTAEAETAFCPIKGATPPRLDAPVKGIYDSISVEILKKFRDPKVVKILSQFGAPPESYLDVFGTAFSKFFQNPVVNDKQLEMFKEAYEEVFGD